MLCEKKYYTAGAVSVFAAMNLIRFLIFFLPNYVFYGGAEWSYVIRFSEVVFDMMIPLLIAVECFVYRGGRRLGGAAARVWLCSLSTAIYALPYYYLYAVSLSISSDRSILWGATAAVVMAAISGLHAFILYLVIGFAARQTVAAAVRERLPKLFSGVIPDDRRGEWREEVGREVADRIGEGRIVSFDSPMPFGILCAAACQFLYRFAVELYSVIDYLITYAGSYRVGEIIYMVASLLFRLLMLFACHAAGYGAARVVRLQVNKENCSEE